MFGVDGAKENGGPKDRRHLIEWRQSGGRSTR